VFGSLAKALVVQSFLNLIFESENITFYIQVHLSICFLGFHIKTKPFPATFPLLFGDKFILEKTFPGKFSLHFST